MLCRFVEGIAVAVHTTEQPSAEEWTQFCEMIGRQCTQTEGSFVYTEGGGPNSQQRDELRRALRGVLPPRTAVVTRSAFARGIVTALNWFYREQQAVAFPPEQMEEALRHACGEGEAAPVVEVVHALRTLASELGVALPEEDSPRQSQG